jgi:hypothetical protein
MIQKIQDHIKALFTFLEVSLDQSSEDINYFQFNNPSYTLPVKLDIEELFLVLEPFKDSIELSFRSSLFVSVLEDKAFFKDWYDDNKGYIVGMNLNIDKNKFVSIIWGSSEYYIPLFINPEIIRNYITYDKFTLFIYTANGYSHIIVPFWDIEMLSNNYICFYGSRCKELNFDKKKLEYEDIIDAQKMYCNSGDLLNNCIPDFFYFQSKNLNDDFSILQNLNKILVTTVLHFICNYSTENQFIIQGFKNTKITNSNLLPSYDKDTLYFFYHIYLSIYTTQVQDKLLITRNVISLHVPPNCTMIELVENLHEIFYSIDTNYDSYIKDKIKSYFEKKKDLEKHVRETSENISKQIVNVTDNLNKSWLALGGAILTAVITYSSRGGSLLSGLFFIVFGGISYLTINYVVWISNKEKEILFKAYKNFLRQIDGINELDKKNITGTIIIEKMLVLKSIIKRLSVFKWLTVFGAVIIALIMFYNDK